MAKTTHASRTEALVYKYSTDSLLCDALKQRLKTEGWCGELAGHDHESLLQW